MKLKLKTTGIIFIELINLLTNKLNKYNLSITNKER